MFDSALFEAQTPATSIPTAAENIMKQRFFIITLVFCYLHANAQQPKELLLEARTKVEGHWVGAIGDDSVFLHLMQTFTEADKLMGVDSIAPIYGWHKISANGNIPEESFSLKNVNPNNGYTVTSGYKKNNNKLYIVIHDITRNRLLGGDFVIKNDSTAILKTWLLETWRNDNKVYPEGQTFPKEIQLTRQQIRSKD